MSDQAYAYDEDVMMQSIQTYRQQMKLLEPEKPLRRQIGIVSPSPKPVAQARQWHVYVERTVVHDLHMLPPCCRSVVAAVLEDAGIGLHELTAKSSVWNLQRPRQLVMYLMHDVCGLTLHAVAAALGGFHHTTVLYGIRQVRKRLARDPGYRKKVDTLALAIDKPIPPNHHLKTLETLVAAANRELARLKGIQA